MSMDVSDWQWIGCIEVGLLLLGYGRYCILGWAELINWWIDKVVLYWPRLQQIGSGGHSLSA